VDHLASRLRSQQVHAGTIELKVRSSEFQTRTFAQLLPVATNATDAL